MKIDLDQFSEQGYLVLRQVIPPDQLDELRASYERLVDRQTLFCAPTRHSRQAGSSKRLSAIVPMPPKPARPQSSDGVHIYVMPYRILEPRAYTIARVLFALSLIRAVL